MAKQYYGRGASAARKRAEDEITEGPRSPMPAPRPKTKAKSSASDTAKSATSKTGGRGGRGIGSPKKTSKAHVHASSTAPSTGPTPPKKGKQYKPKASKGRTSKKIPQYEKKKAKATKRLNRSKAGLARYGGTDRNRG